MRKSSRFGSTRLTRPGPATTSGIVTTPVSSPITYNENDSTRVFTIPRCPPRPYMIVMVSTKTFSARDPDHSARMKPTEITSNRPPRNTSLRVGRTMASTVCGVSAREHTSRIDARTCSTCEGLMFSNT